MTPERRERLKAAGIVPTTPEDSLGLTDIERKVVEFRLGLARELRRLRGERGLSQSDIAAIIQISQSRMPGIERGEGASLEAIMMAYLAAGGELPSFKSLDLEPLELPADATIHIDAQGGGRIGNEIASLWEGTAKPARKRPEEVPRAKPTARPKSKPATAKSLVEKPSEDPSERS